MNKRVQTLKGFLNRSFNRRAGTIVPKMQSLAGFMTGVELQRLNQMTRLTQLRQEIEEERQRSLQENYVLMQDERAQTLEAVRDRENVANAEAAVVWERIPKDDESEDWR